MRHPIPPLTALIALALATCTWFGCTTESADPDVAEDFGEASDMPVTANGDSLPSGAAAQPGNCFEIFGPDGISHDAPRVHTAGDVVVGETFETSVRFYNFCSDPDAALLRLDVTATTGLHVAFAGFSDGAAVSPLIDVAIALTPSSPGAQSAEFRMHTNHGWYDFTIVVEGVDPVP